MKIDGELKICYIVLKLRRSTKQTPYTAQAPPRGLVSKPANKSVTMAHETSSQLYL